ncbi:MAG: heme biosynthesis HemY N-terminal domain-containing protein [Mariprofundaceae bacterium]|nr:heme biosynthesis HemY N-terminal domain-containing protein [Mariprofundaceae bacterium]
MRVFIILVFSLSLALLFGMFPEIADRSMSIRAFGWLFETRQGPFILLLVLLLAAYWLLRRLMLALLAGPGQLWDAMSSGSKKRKEGHLRDGLADWLDERGDRGWKSFRKARGLLPEGGDALLARLPLGAADIPSPQDEDALLSALSARIATDPHAFPQPDAGLRQAHLDAWLKAHPGAPLALARQADLLEENGNWRALADTLKETWRRGGHAGVEAAPRLASAYLHLAEDAMRNDDEKEQALAWMRKAHRLRPESDAIVLALGRALLAADDTEACRKLWLAHIQQRDSSEIAIELADLLRDDALKTYRKLERKHVAGMTPALRLLRASLAHAAGLDGLATEQIEALLADHPSPEAWRVLGDWRAQSGDSQGSADAYRQGMDCQSAII